jgi:coenzyme F420-reducing hydrogenase delta subunit
MEPERVRMFNMSSAMGSEFGAAAQEMFEQILNLGSNPLKK